MSKQALREKIISDATSKAEQILSEQREKADAILSAAQSESDKNSELAMKELEVQKSDIIARAKTVAELDARKLMLAAKRELINRVFDRALEKLMQLDDKSMKSLLLSMLSGAEDGDVVLLNARGKSLLTEKDIAAYAKSRGIKLSLCENAGNFRGGLQLIGNGVSKNFTFEVELSLLRERSESDIAKQIFG